MTSADERQQLQQRFLKALCEQTDGDPQRQVSMYKVGEDLGLDRETASRVAQDLMAEGQVAVKTLSGEIGITEEGVALVGGPGPQVGPEGLPVKGPLLARHCQAVESALAAVKAVIGTKGLNFDDLAQAMADIRTIEAQMAAPKPNSVVIRACLEALAEPLAKSGPCTELTALRRLLA